MNDEPSGLATFYQLLLGPVVDKGETEAAAVVIPYLTDDPFFRLAGFRFHFEMHAVHAHIDFIDGGRVGVSIEGYRFRFGGEADLNVAIALRMLPRAADLRRQIFPAAAAAD